jgi:hypothetical protein
MKQFGGKNAKKTSSDSKRHFTIVMGGKEHGLYVSSTPSSAAKKAVTKLCAANKSKKVEFYIREITQGSKKKTYGPYEGHIEKLKEPIELKGRIIKYKPIAKLSGKTSKKMKGGDELLDEIKNFISKTGNKENREKLVSQAKNLLEKILNASQSSDNPINLVILLDTLYHINIYYSKEINVKSAFNIIKEKYDNLRAQDQTEDHSGYPKVYPPLKE